MSTRSSVLVMAVGPYRKPDVEWQLWDDHRQLMEWWIVMVGCGQSWLSSHESWLINHAYIFSFGYLTWGVRRHPYRHPQIMTRSWLSGPRRQDLENAALAKGKRSKKRAPGDHWRWEVGIEWRWWRWCFSMEMSLLVEPIRLEMFLSFTIPLKTEASPHKRYIHHECNAPYDVQYSNVRYCAMMYCHAMLGAVSVCMSCHVIWYHVISCHIMSFHIRSSCLPLLCVMLHYVISAFAMSGVC